MSTARSRDGLALLGVLAVLAVLAVLGAAGPGEPPAATTAYLTPQYTPYLGAGGAVPDGSGWAAPPDLDGTVLWVGLAVAVWFWSARRQWSGRLY